MWHKVFNPSLKARSCWWQHSQVNGSMLCCLLLSLHTLSLCYLFQATITPGSQRKLNVLDMFFLQMPANLGHGTELHALNSKLAAMLRVLVSWVMEMFRRDMHSCSLTELKLHCFARKWQHGKNHSKSLTLSAMLV